MGKTISEQAFAEAAEDLGCEIAAIKAVAEVESRGDGFLQDNRPKILFERHIFSRTTGRKYDGSHPDISNRKAGGYQGGAKEHDRLKEAMALDEEAALKSASWGRFQIMGFNHAACGYDSVQDFVAAMEESEDEHLQAFFLGRGVVGQHSFGEDGHQQVLHFGPGRRCLAQHLAARLTHQLVNRRTRQV